MNILLVRLLQPDKQYDPEIKKRGTQNFSADGR